MHKYKSLVFIIPLILIVGVSIGGAYENAHAQTPVTIDINSLSAQTIVILIVIGIGAAVFQAYQGWSASGEAFVPKAFLDRILAGALHSIWISITTALSYPTMAPIVYVLVFGAAIGFTEISLKAVSSVSQPDPTASDIPSPPDATSSNTIQA